MLVLTAVISVPDITSATVKSYNGVKQTHTIEGLQLKKVNTNNEKLPCLNKTQNT
jgi:hypothetical protein